MRISDWSSDVCSSDLAKIDVGAMVGRKDKIVKQFTGGIAMLFKANKVTPYYGFGQLQPGNVVKVKQHDGSEVELKAANVVLAAGSDSIELPFAKFDGEYRSEEHTSELQSLMRNSYAVFCLKKK